MLRRHNAANWALPSSDARSGCARSASATGAVNLRRHHGVHFLRRSGRSIRLEECLRVCSHRTRRSQRVGRSVGVFTHLGDKRGSASLAEEPAHAQVFARHGKAALFKSISKIVSMVRRRERLRVRVETVFHCEAELRVPRNDRAPSSFGNLIRTKGRAASGSVWNIPVSAFNLAIRAKEVTDDGFALRRTRFRTRRGRDAGNSFAHPRGSANDARGGEGGNNARRRRLRRETAGLARRHD